MLDHAPPRARLVFSCGWHITRDGQDVYSWKLKTFVKVVGWLARLVRFADLAASRGESGALPHLACFFKRPFGVGEHDLHRQWHMLCAYLDRVRSDER